MVYIRNVERLIRVTSDALNDERNRAIAMARTHEAAAHELYSFHSPIFSDILIAPDLKGKALGLFSIEDKLIILNEKIMNLDEAVRDNIIKHELSHALEYALTGISTGHTPLFRAICKGLGIDEGFEKAKIVISLKERDKKARKIEKLLALSTSPFENEAMEALEKAQKLMLENRIESHANTKEEKIYYSSIYSSGRTPFYITSILNFVSESTGAFIVRSSKGGKIHSTCYGSLEEVELSIYLFDYICSALEQEVRKSRTAGIGITRDSFILGAIPEMRKHLYSADNANKEAIVKVRDENAKLCKRLVFTDTKLRTKKYSVHMNDAKSYDNGKKFGKSLAIPRKIDIKKLV